MSGCGSSTNGNQDMSMSVDLSVGPCTQTLAAFCSGSSKCGTYDQVRARASAGQCFNVVSGTCGSLRYLEVSPHGLDNEIYYFATDGTLLTVVEQADYTSAYCNGTSGERTSGPIQSCVRTQTEVVCHCDHPLTSGTDGGC